MAKVTSTSIVLPTPRTTGSMTSTPTISGSDLVDHIESFYSNAFNTLMYVFVIVGLVAGIAIPIIIQYFAQQRQKFRFEKQIKSQEEKFRAETLKLQEEFNKTIKKTHDDLNKTVSYLSGAIIAITYDSDPFVSSCLYLKTLECNLNIEEPLISLEGVIGMFIDNLDNLSEEDRKEAQKTFDNLIKDRTDLKLIAEILIKRKKVAESNTKNEK